MSDGTDSAQSQIEAAGALIDAPHGGADVFISYGSRDLALAREIRSHLEAGGYDCWMSPDDVAGVKSWAEQIVEAIAACKVMLVLVSSVSNASDHVSKEVDLAIEHGKAVLPVRIEDVVPSGALRYLLALAQWIDAFPGPIGPHADEVKRRVAAMLVNDEETPLECAPTSEAPGEPPPSMEPVTTPPVVVAPITPRPEPSTAERGTRRRWAYVAAGVVAAVTIGLIVAMLARGGDPYTYGDDTRLDWLWDRCDAGDMPACDAMVDESATGTEYVLFGITCGERVVGGGGCVDRGIGEASPHTYGDDPELDGLWDGCNGAIFEACAQLFESAPAETEYEQFGGSCGGRTEFPQGCGPLLEGGSDLEVLWEACEFGDMGACAELYQVSPPESVYEEFGRTCGGRTDGAVACVFTYGDSPYLDGLWNACDAGEMEACDLLYLDSPAGSEYEAFGWTCGWMTDGGGNCAGS
jgi:hypothetical protein